MREEAGSVKTCGLCSGPYIPVHRPRRCSLFVRFLFVSVGLVGLWVARLPMAQAQVEENRPVRFRESVSLETDMAAAKMLRSVEDLSEAGQWEEAVELLQEISRERDENLVPISPGRYVNVAFYRNVLLSRFPKEGLEVYRSLVDPQARRWYEAAVQRRDTAGLQKLLRFALASSYGDNALMQLAEWSWQHGDIDSARRYWRQLLPRSRTEPNRSADAAGAFGSVGLRYPDPEFAPADIRARLILCSLAEGDFPRARRQLDAFRRLHPEAAGRLAGQSGKLVEILERLASEARRWELPAVDDAPQTFAMRADRNGTVSKGMDVGAELWSIPFPMPELRPLRLKDPRPGLPEMGPASVHPVVFGDVVLFATAEHVYAFNLHTGRPAWGVDEQDRGILYPRPPAERFPTRNRRAVGIPRYTLTVHGGRLFAKIGTPVTSRSLRAAVFPPRSELVCLDLAQAEGEVLWRRSADEISRQGPPFSFEGHPVAAGDRVYVALRRSQPETQSNVACFDAATGRLLWNRKVCAATSDIGRWQNLITHNLLTVGGGSVYFSTDMGAVAALDAQKGTLRWVVTYESEQDQKAELLSDYRRHGLLPCLYHAGLVFAAPNDSEQILAIDAQTGEVVWRQTVRDRVRHLLGAREGRLFVSGNSLWALDLETGRVLWGHKESDPEFSGYGRGLLVGDEIWFPRYDAIEIRSQKTGRPVGRRPILLQRHSRSPGPKTGGNLLIVGDYLLVAQADRLVAYSRYSLPATGPKRLLSAIARP